MKKSRQKSKLESSDNGAKFQSPALPRRERALEISGWADASCSMERSGFVHSPESLEPIFVHSGFRTSSTWFWQKLRNAPGVLAYCEIFHEMLASIDAGDASRLHHDSWRSKHPAAAPYFLEYLPLLRASGGIPAYDAKMAYDMFIPAGGMEGGLSLEEKNYVDCLLQNAYSNRKIPVLTCTRSLGRAGALRKAYGGTSILLYRNLFHQWASYTGQSIKGNGYFLSTINRFISVSRHDVFLRWLDDWFSTRAESPDDEQMFQVFLLLHLYLYARALESCDLVVDVTALSSDKARRAEVENKLSRLVSFPVDLSDVRREFELSVVHVKSVPLFVDTIEQFTKFIIGTCSTIESVEFVQRVKNEALAEWNLYEFFSRGVRSAQAAKIADADRQRDALAGREAETAAALDALATQLSETAAGRDALQAALNGVTGERDALAKQLSEAVASRAALEPALSELTGERNDLAARLSEAAAARESLEAALNDVTEERNAVVARLSEAVAARESFEEALTSATAERDAFAELTTDALASRDSLQLALTRMTVERDSLDEQLSDALAKR